MRLRPQLALLALFILGAADAAPWLQSSGDAAHTGATSDPGPEFGDVALALQVDGSRAFAVSPIIADRHVYVLTSMNGFDAGRRTNAVWRIGLDDGVVAKLVELPEPAWGWASDGTSLFVSTDNATTAYSLSDGARGWVTPHPALAPDRRFTACIYLQVVDERLAQLCADVGGGDVDLTGVADIFRVFRNGTIFQTYATQLDSMTGERQWLSTMGSEGLETPAGLAPPGPEWPSVQGETVNGLAVVGDHVIVSGAIICPCPALGARPLPATDGADCLVRSFAASDGRLEWLQRASLLADADHPPAACSISSEPTGRDDVVFVKMNDVFALNAARGGSLIRRWPIGVEDRSGSDPGSGLAFSNGRLWAARRATLYAIDVEATDVLASRPEPLEPQSAFSATALIVANGRLYARSAPPDSDTANTIHAFDAQTLEPIWNLTFEHHTDAYADTQFGTALGEGVFVVQGVDGQVVIIGRTRASPQPAPRASSVFPGPGESVEVDLTASGAGLLGPATRYRADWGDNSTSDWQAEAVLIHAYASPGERSARFSVANDAGQIASSLVVFHVGTPEPNILSEAFAPGRQELTLFLIGLAITGVGGLFGVMRYQRRRGRLAKELRALAAAYTATRGRPADAEAVLAERRARVFGLFVDGALEQREFDVLDRRIDEIARELRMGTVDERLRFLPHGMALDLREILRDGRITDFEHRHFVDALERATELTDDQRARVRALVDDWRARDVGAPHPARTFPRDEQL